MKDSIQVSKCGCGELAPAYCKECEESYAEKHKCEDPEGDPEFFGDSDRVDTQY